MRRPPRMAARGGEHRADRPVVRDRVRHRADGEERVASVLPGREAAAEVLLGSARVLHRVQPVVAVLPDVELGACDRVAVAAGDDAVDPGGLAGRLLGDRGAVVAHRRVRHVERAEHGRLGRSPRRVREGVDEHREAERVRPQDELLAVLVGDPPGLGEEPDRGLPLVERQPDLGGERVEMGREGLDEPPEALVRAAGEARDGCRGDVRGGRASAPAPTEGSVTPPPRPARRSRQPHGRSRPSPAGRRARPAGGPTRGSPRPRLGRA